MTFFEIMTAMAFAAFADAPVDVAVVEVGLGGTWDATNVADAGVAVVTPIDLDHTHLLGTTVAEIAREKAGIIKPGAHAILAGQPLEAAQVLLERCAEVGALPQREGIDFGVLDRQLAVGGQLVRAQRRGGPGRRRLPARCTAPTRRPNAAQALAAVEAFLGLKALNPDVVREGFAQVEVARPARGRPALPDGGPRRRAQPARRAAAVAGADREAFDFTPLVGVVGVMADKDARRLLRDVRGVMTSVVVTQVASHPRGMPAEELGELAAEVFGAERVRVAPRLDDALEAAVGLAEGDGAGSPGVLVTGSVVAVGEARTLLVTSEPARGHAAARPRRRLGCRLCRRCGEPRR